MRKLQMAAGEESADSAQATAYNALGIFDHGGESIPYCSKFPLCGRKRIAKLAACEIIDGSKARLPDRLVSIHSRSDDALDPAAVLIDG